MHRTRSGISPRSSTIPGWRFEIDSRILFMIPEDDFFLTHQVSLITWFPYYPFTCLRFYLFTFLRVYVFTCVPVYVFTYLRFYFWPRAIAQSIDE